METKLKNPKPGSKAAPPPQRGPCPPFPEREIVRSGPRHQGYNFASLRAEPGDSLFMRERGELQRGGISTRTRLHKGAILQPSSPGRGFNELGVAKLYCTNGPYGTTISKSSRSGTVGLFRRRI